MASRLGDRAVAGLLGPSAWLVAALPVLLLAFVAAEAAPALWEYGPVAFLTDARWGPTTGRVGLAPMLAGSVVSSFLAVAVAAPWAVAFAVHVNHFAPAWLAAVARGTVGLLAGIPSVVFGLVALTHLVPLLAPEHPPGLGLGVAVVTLTAMIVPTAAAAADAAVRQVPAEGPLAARALGLGAWDAARSVVLPMAAPGIRAGLLLALGRAIGETMAVLMVAGNTVQYPTGPFTPFRTLTGNVAVEMSYATGLHRSALFVSALALLGLVVAVLALHGRGR